VAKLPKLQYFYPMHFFKLVLGVLWRFWFFFLAGVTFLLFYPAFHILLSKEKWYGKAFKLKRFWGPFFLIPAGLRLKVISSPDLEKVGPCVITPNHISYLDIVFTFMAIPKHFHMIGKAELAKLPLFNKFFDGMNILVDRNSIMSSHKSLQRAAEDIDKGINIVIFPEATIPESAPKLGRFKNGAFKLAIMKQVPVLPVVFLDNYKLMPDKPNVVNGGRPGTCRVVIKNPVPTIGMTEADVDTLKTTIFNIINNTLIEYSYGNQ
jgi:1-acyl-sn-glycerol-3-phosphate acyltransferase